MSLLIFLCLHLLFFTCFGYRCVCMRVCVCVFYGHLCSCAMGLVAWNKFDLIWFDLKVKIWKLSLTRTPDPIRPTRRGPEPNQPTGITFGGFSLGVMSGDVSRGGGYFRLPNTLQPILYAARRDETRCDQTACRRGACAVQHGSSIVRARYNRIR